MTQQFDDFDTQIQSDEDSNACDHWDAAQRREIDEEWGELSAYDVEDDGDDMTEDELLERLEAAALSHDDTRTEDDTPRPPECMWCERPAVGLLKMRDHACEVHGQMYDSERFPFTLYEDMGPND